MQRTRLIALTTVAAAVLALGFAAPSFAGMNGMQARAEKTVQVGGAPMYPSKNIVQNAVNSKDHTTLVAAVKAAGLVDTLQGPGPFTVFAPTDDAFAKLPPETVEQLKTDAPLLNKILTYHVVAGRLTAADIAAQAQANGGTATLKTVQGEELKVSAGPNNTWVITDAKGGKSTITQADVGQSNGVVHVVDTVLMP